MKSYIIIISCFIILSCSNKKEVKNDKIQTDKNVLGKLQKQKSEDTNVKHWDTIRGYLNDDDKEDMILSYYNKEKGEFYYKVLFEKNNNYLITKTDTINDDFSYLINEGEGNVIIYTNNKNYYSIRVSCCSSTRDYEEYIYNYNNKSKVWVLKKTFEYRYRPKMKFSITYPEERDFIYYEKMLDSLLKVTQIKFEEKNLEGIEKEINDLFLVGEIVHNVSKNPENIVKLNDLAYYLEQTEKGDALSIFLLEKIVKEAPNRTVAYINLGDAYWGIGEKEEAKKAYKTYVNQMKANGKESKIPKIVLERI